MSGLSHPYGRIKLLGVSIDCKTVRIFVYSSTHEQSNKRSGTRLKTERQRLALRACEACGLRHALPISLLILRKTPTVLQSRISTEMRSGLIYFMEDNLFH